MRILLLVALAALPLFANAQASTAIVVSTCGSASYSAGQAKATTQDTAGNACVSTGGSSSGGGTVVQGPGTAGTPSGGVLSVQGVVGGTAQPVSAGSLPLPSGASTAAAQTNVQSAAGTPDATVLNVQGNASGVALPVSGTITVQPVAVTTTDKGGTISSGGVAQTAIASNASRKAWCIQNPPSATETLTVRVNGTATATASAILAPGSQACNQPGTVDTAAVSVIATTTSHAYSGWEAQ